MFRVYHFEISLLAAQLTSAVQYRRRADPPSTRSAPSTIQATRWPKAKVDLEFFFLQHPQEAARWEERPVQPQAPRDVAVLVRSALFDIADVSAEVRSQLASEPYRFPLEWREPTMDTPAPPSVAKPE
jgi:hypothetical protein